MSLQLPFGTPIFFQPWWLDATGKSWQMLSVQNGDAVAGLWPVVMEKRYGISFQQNPPLCPYFGPQVFFPPNLKESNRDSFEYQTISALLEQLPPAQVVSLALTPGLKQVGLFKQAGFGMRVRQTFLMDLENATEADLFDRMHEKSRRNIRKTAKEMEIVDAPEEIENAYHFQKATLLRKGLKMHFPFPYLKNLFDASYSRGQSALWAARKDGITQALLWHVWDDQHSYYIGGAKNPTVKDTRAVTALLWQAMNHSRLLGKETFDFEGSMDPGVESFFRSFGGRKELYLVLEKNQSLLWRMKGLLR